MACTLISFAHRAGLLAGLLAGPIAATQAQSPTWQPVVVTTPAITYATATVTATAADASGNVYVGGYFSQGIKLGSTTLISAGGEDIFLAKWLPATQSFAWVQRAGGPGDERLAALTTSGGSLYAAGYFYSTAAFGSTTLTSAGSADAFVARLTDGGSSAAFTWAQRAGGPGFDRAQALALSGPAVYVAGNFNGTATFGSTSATSAGATDGFVARLTEAGSSATFTWVQPVGGSSEDDCTGIAAQGSAVYLTGLFRGTVVLGTTSLASGSAANAFVAKLADTGTSPTYTWAQKAGGSNFTMPTALAVQGSQLYVAGYFLGAASFGSISLPNVGNADLFVARLTDAGASASFDWARGAGSATDDVVSALSVQGSRVYVSGYFTGTVSFGLLTLTNQPTRATSDVFVACLADAGPGTSWAWAVSAGGGGSDNATALASVGTTLYVGGILSGLATFGTQSVGGARNGASGFFTSLSDVIGLAATAAAPAAARVALYPTPTPAGTQATVPLPAATGAALTVLDNLGRVIRTLRVAAGSPQATLDVAGLAPGVYALHVATGEGLSTARLVVE